MPLQDFYYSAQTPVSNENTVAYGMELVQFSSLDPPPLPSRHLVGIQQSVFGQALLPIAMHEACLPLGHHPLWFANPIQYFPHPTQKIAINQEKTYYDAQILSHNGPESHISIPQEAPEVASSTEIPFAMDPFAHVDPCILDLIAAGSGIRDLSELPSRCTPSGQETSNTRHINDVRRSEGTTKAPENSAVPIAETSAACPYKFKRQRSSTKADKTASRRPRAPAVVATTADDTANGPIKCKACGKKFAQRQNLNRHVRLAHLGGCKWTALYVVPEYRDMTH
ncbi:predicted protein [Postia placenta Mad-698-R]|uniref:C2H2-type domain-containing protein n=1 Tax=Postia placenta MAD-698-R-SB12 TaxID=670580 RepID=A0A1X6N0I0_9APHY|nr:hypothetical protein POSPLADRAFT_1143540 [Postia placenta MAD-698-R-SB12]EED80407.1 predicted protein [Postia placenta Mad-698-R]OSX62104.1 hypothetical protein POSPLADRAFT_1143540 [Postia placenta MAD-698-R-SB12]